MQALHHTSMPRTLLVEHSISTPKDPSVQCMPGRSGAMAHELGAHCISIVDTHMGGLRLVSQSAQHLQHGVTAARCGLIGSV